MSKLLVALVVSLILIVTVIGVSLELKLAPSFNARTFLNNSYFGYLLNNTNFDAPVGIATYGITNNSCTLQPYSIYSSEVVGEVNVSALSTLTTWNYSIEPFYSELLVCVQCAAIQMNVNIIANTLFGDQIFRVQNVVAFWNTSDHEVRNFQGTISNLTTASSNVTFSSIGNGRFGGEDNQTTYSFGSYFGTSTNDLINYTLPLRVRLATSVQLEPKGIEIRMSRIIRLGVRVQIITLLALLRSRSRT